MRITGGRLRGKALFVPEGRAIRPTADRARESIFNILQHGAISRARGITLDGAHILDVFAGTGAFGLDALSRGAAHITFIDNAGQAARALRRNIAHCNAGNATTVITADAVNPPPAERNADIVFLDPPYGEDLLSSALPALVRQGWIGDMSLVIAETGAREAPNWPDGFTACDDRRYGAARIVFLQYLPARQ